MFFTKLSIRTVRASTKAQEHTWPERAVIGAQMQRIDKICLSCEAALLCVTREVNSYYVCAGCEKLFVEYIPDRYTQHRVTVYVHNKCKLPTGRRHTNLCTACNKQQFDETLKYLEA